ncbi:MAG: hypothetical protein ACOYN0_00660 [Phycisphaerales bacterium]
MKLMRSIVVLACLAPTARVTFAQEWVGFDAALGTDPLAQCFSAFGVGNLPATQEERVVTNGELRLRTSGGVPHLGSPSDQPKAGFFARRDLDFRFTDGFAMEANLSVLHAGVSASSLVLRTGLTMNAADSSGRMVGLWWGNGGLWLVGNFFTETTTAPDIVLPTMSEPHTYRVETDATHMSLFIDGALAVRKPLGSPGGHQPRVCFGDASRWVDANCDIRVRDFRFFATQPVPAVMPPVHYLPPCRLGAASLTIDVPVPQWSVLTWEFRNDAGDWLPLSQGLYELRKSYPAPGTVVLQPLSVRASDLEWWLRARLDATDASSRCTTGYSEPVRVRFCISDFNCDGGVDSDDTILFFAALDRNHGSADINRDGGIDADDIIDFFAGWDSGCN